MQIIYAEKKHSRRCFSTGLRIIIVVAGLLTNAVGYAQVANYTFVQSNGIYEAITSPDFSYTGADLIYKVFNDVNIGFTFKYDGIDYNSIGISGGCGYIQVGRNASSGYFPDSMSKSLTTVSPFYGGHRTRATSNLSYATKGVAPNRVFTVQWSALGVYNFFNIFDPIAGDFNFQIQLFESTNKISFVYGNIATPNIVVSSVQVGITGHSKSDYLMRTDGTTWESTNKALSPVDRVKVGLASSPPAGLTFTFGPATLCTGVPTPGIVSVTPPSGALFTGDSAVLSLSGYSTGIPIQWQSSASSDGTYTDIPGAASETYNTGAVLVQGTTYYRAKLSCAASGGVAYSNVVAVTASAMEQPGNALQFTGSPKGVSVPPNPLFDLVTATFEAMIKPESFNGENKPIVGLRNDPLGTRFSLHVNEKQVGVFNGSTWSAISTPPFVLGRWYHIAAVIKAAATDLYINGAFIGSTTNGMGSTTGLPLRIGSVNASATNEVFHGAIDEIRIWNVERSAAEIKDNRYDTVPVASPGLLAYYRFDQGEASGTNTDITTLYDATSNRLHGTLSDFSLTGSTSNWVESYAMVVPRVTQPTAVNSQSFTANWLPPARGIAEKYFLDVSKDIDFNFFLIDYNGKDVGTVTSYAITGLEPNTHYFYRVRAEKASVTGQGGYSGIIEAATSQTILPISFSFISAYERNTGVGVKWKVESESNMEGYIVERSSNGVTFVKVAEIKAGANNYSTAEYEWYDPNISGNINYYRIKAIEKTGNSKYSMIVNVKVNTTKGSIVISPNPVRGSTLNLQISNLPRDIYILSLYNDKGQRVLVKTIQHYGGSATQTLRLPNLSGGVYTLKINGSKKELIRRLIY